MDIFDQYADEATALLSQYPMQKLETHGSLWPLTERTPFIMERDTAVELGGYPQESINLILSSSSFGFEEPGSVFLIGNPDALCTGNSRLSYGKIVLLETEDIEPERTYEYLKNAELADIRLRFQDVMLRMSSQKFFTNLRIGKKALHNGFSLEKMSSTMLQQFSELPRVNAARIILIVGSSPLYKQLLPIAEQVKDITVTLNTMLDGMEFNCKSCNLSAVCAEVEGLRKLHAATGKSIVKRGI